MIQSLNSKVVWKVIFIEKWSSPIETKTSLELTLTKTSAGMGCARIKARRSQENKSTIATLNLWRRMRSRERTNTIKQRKKVVCKKSTSIKKIPNVIMENLSCQANIPISYTIYDDVSCVH
jgi:hypothetical protein